MNTETLVAIARKCGDRTVNCKKECPYYNHDANCLTRLLHDMADKLEQSKKE